VLSADDRPGAGALRALIGRSHACSGAACDSSFLIICFCVIVIAVVIAVPFKS
jgi:hypothetical protein